MKLPMLYARTNTGAVQTWCIEVFENKYRTYHGQLDGAIQITEWTVCRGKNTGKSNGTTDNEQAIKDSKSIWKKKKESGYFDNIKDVDNETFTEPMLAKNYDDYKDELKYPVYCQPKLDGCLHEGTEVITTTGVKVIKDIVTGDMVLSYNTFNNYQEFKKVLGKFINGKDIHENTYNWYKITLENGKTLTLTGNHRVWINNLQVWRRVDELDGTEDLLLN